MNNATRSRNLESLLEFPSNPTDLLNLTRRAFSKVGESIHAFPVSIQKKSTGYQLKADLPGIKKEDIDITLADNILTIKVMKAKTEKEVNLENEFIFNERFLFEEDVSRRFYLKDEMDKDKLLAHLKEGVLTLDIFNKEKPEPQKIKIEDEPIQQNSSSHVNID